MSCSMLLLTGIDPPRERGQRCVLVTTGAQWSTPRQKKAHDTNRPIKARAMAREANIVWGLVHGITSLALSNRLPVPRPGCAPPPQRGQQCLFRTGVPETTGVYEGAITPCPDTRELLRRVIAQAVP